MQQEGVKIVAGINTNKANIHIKESSPSIKFVGGPPIENTRYEHS